MKQRLQDFIDQNREAFDADLPAPELWNKIAAHSPNVRKGRRLSLAVAIQRIAAAAVLLLLVASGLHWVLSERNSHVNRNGEMHRAQFEIQEASRFYELQIADKKQRVFELTTNDPTIRHGIEIDMADLDEVLLQLKHDLKDDVANAEVLAAMIQNYRLKLEILEQTLQFIEQEEAKQPKEILYEL